jgi:hypothetical protein
MGIPFSDRMRGGMPNANQEVYWRMGDSGFLDFPMPYVIKAGWSNDQPAFVFDQFSGA